MKLKNFMFFLCGILFLSPAEAQVLKSAAWTWINGTDTINKNSVHGTRRVPAPTNLPGGRDGAASWTDTAGNFWLFGGEGRAAVGTGENRLNDMWKYDPAADEWTFMHGDTNSNVLGNYGTLGVSALTNKPGTRHRSAFWTDASGKFWMFGGRGRAGSGITTSYLNDLWTYDPATNEWTWVSGDGVHYVNGVYGTQGVAAATNKPGGREGASAWVDKEGDFWIFGGVGLGASSGGTTENAMNDLWKYNPKDNLWTWVKGDSVYTPDSLYGTRGVSSPANKPPAHKYASAWTDTAGDLWMFGGQNWQNQSFNDLWKYSPATNEWTWMGGDSTLNQFGKYGIQGTGDPANAPGSRNSATAWQGPDGYFWLFGGAGYAGFVNAPGPWDPVSGYLNDLWLYDVAANEWTWVHGDTVFGVNGMYGTKGVSDPTNKPGTRYYASANWKDAQGDLWMFGGRGRSKNNISDGRLNDLWKLEACFLVGQPQRISGDDTVCQQSVQTYSINPVVHAESYVWTLPAGWVGTSTSESITVTAGTTGGTIRVYAHSHCDSGQVQTLDVFVPVFVPVNIEVDSFVLSANAAYASYQWYKDGDSIPGATDSFYVVTENAAYSLTVTDIYGCTDSSTAYRVNNVQVDALYGAGKQVHIYPNPAGSVIYIDAAVPLNVYLRSPDGRTVLYQASGGAINIGHLAAGVYMVQVTDREGRLLRAEKLVKVTE